MEFVQRNGGGDVKLTTYTAYLCSQHFTTDSFSNWQKKQLGFAGSLMLVSGAVPTVVNFVSERGSTVVDRPAASRVSLGILVLYFFLHRRR